MGTQPKQLKIMSIFGTRPEIIRISSVLKELDKYTDHIMIHTGQSYDYEMSEVFFSELGLRKPNHFLEVKADTLGKQIANIIERSEEVLIKEQPDAVVILGDTNSALAGIVAKRMHIPIFHMEAGNRAFDSRIPEETNRKIIDHISDINLPYSENARMNLLREGIHPGTVFVTGSPMMEVLTEHQDKINASKILSELKLKPQQYMVASIHREENVSSQDTLTTLFDILGAAADLHKMPLVMSVHPRTKSLMEQYKITPHKSIVLHKPFGYFDYNKLQQDAFCVLSDSGSIHEEAAVLQFPAVQMRVSSERPEAFDEGVAVLSGLNKDVVLEAIKMVTEQLKEQGGVTIPYNYQGKYVSKKVVRHILGLTKIVQQRKLKNELN